MFKSLWHPEEQDVSPVSSSPPSPQTPTASGSLEPSNAQRAGGHNAENDGLRGNGGYRGRHAACPEAARMRDVMLQSMARAHCRGGEVRGCYADAPVNGATRGRCGCECSECVRVRQLESNWRYALPALPAPGRMRAVFFRQSRCAEDGAVEIAVDTNAWCAASGRTGRKQPM